MRLELRVSHFLSSLIFAEIQSSYGLCLLSKKEVCPSVSASLAGAFSFSFSSCSCSRSIAVNKSLPFSLNLSARASKQSLSYSAKSTLSFLGSSAIAAFRFSIFVSSLDSFPQLESYHHHHSYFCKLKYSAYIKIVAQFR